MCIIPIGHMISSPIIVWAMPGGKIRLGWMECGRIYFKKKLAECAELYPFVTPEPVLESTFQSVPYCQWSFLFLFGCDLTVVQTPPWGWGAMYAPSASDIFSPLFRPSKKNQSTVHNVFFIYFMLQHSLIWDVRPLPPFGYCNYV